MGKFGIGARVRHEIGTGIIISKAKGYRRVRFDARRDYELWVKKENLEPDTSEPSSDCSPAELQESLDATSRPITVRAGGYYKTRSGEIVGPMMRSSIAEFPFTAVLYPNLESWRKDGTWSLFPGIPTDLDLISAASAPEPKHKVGDRVVVLDNHTIFGDTHKVDVGSVHTITEAAGYGGSWVLSGLPGRFLWDSQLAAAPLEEGDTVHLTSLVGTISRTSEHDDKVRVDLGDGDFAWVSPNKLAA